MFNLSRKLYPLEYILGSLEVLKLFLPITSNPILNGLLLGTLILKQRMEGFRSSIFIFLMAILIGIVFKSQVLSSLGCLYFMFFSHRLSVFELPSDGPAVGHKWLRGGWLKDYQISELGVFYPAQSST